MPRPAIARRTGVRHSERIYRQAEQRLPMELIAIVIALATDLKALCACALVCKAWLADARLALYSSINIHTMMKRKPGDTLDSGISKRMQDLDMFYQRHPEFKAKVKSSTFSVDCPYALWRHIPDILATFPGLSYLEIEFIFAWTEEGHLWRYIGNLGPSRRYSTQPSRYRSRLRSLKISDMAPFAFTTLILEGIENTQEHPLQVLSLDGIARGIDGQPTPSLEDLTKWFDDHSGIFCNLLSLEVGRPSEYLDHNSDTLIYAIASLPATEFPNLKSYTFAPISTRAARAGLEFLEQIADQITDFDWKANFELSLSRTPPDIKRLSALLHEKGDLLSKCPNLRSLKLPMVVPDYDEFPRTTHGEGYPTYPTIQTWIAFLAGIGSRLNSLEHFTFNIHFKTFGFRHSIINPALVRVPNDPLPFLFPLTPSGDRRRKILNAPGLAIKALFESVLANKDSECDFGALRRVNFGIHILHGYQMEDPCDPQVLKLTVPSRREEHWRERKTRYRWGYPSSPWAVDFEEELKHSFMAHVVGDLAKTVDVEVAVTRYYGDPCPEVEI